MPTDPTATAARHLRNVETYRKPTPKERERDIAVLNALMAEWTLMTEPKPDLPTWLNGATTALLIARRVDDGYQA